MWTQFPSWIGYKKFSNRWWNKKSAGGLWQYGSLLQSEHFHVSTELELFG